MSYPTRIPDDANPFYVSDAFSLAGALTTAGGGTHMHFPGAANQSMVVWPSATGQPQKKLRVWIKSLSMSLIAFSASPNINVDLHMALYRLPWVDGAPAGPIVPVDLQDLDPSIAFWEKVMPFIAPYGTAPNGIIGNHVMRTGEIPRSTRDFGVDLPLMVGCNVPFDMDCLFLVGAALRFHYDAASPTDAAYEYHVHGAWKDS